jgi:hypothetical protein
MEWTMSDEKLPNSYERGVRDERSKASDSVERPAHDVQVKGAKDILQATSHAQKLNPQPYHLIGKANEQPIDKTLAQLRNDPRFSEAAVDQAVVDELLYLGAKGIPSHAIGLGVLLDGGTNVVGEGFAGKVALAKSAIATAQDTIDYMTDREKLNMDNYGKTLLDAGTSLDPIHALTALAGGATNMVGIDTGVQSISISSVVDRLEGGKGEQVSNIAGETLYRYEQEQKRFKPGELPVSERISDESDPNKPRMENFKHLAAMKGYVVAYLPGGKIDGHNLMTEFDKIDFNKRENLQLYNLGLNKAQAEQMNIMEENKGSWWVPRWARHGESTDKYNAAESTTNQLGAALKEFGMFEDEMSQHKSSKQTAIDAGLEAGFAGAAAKKVTDLSAEELNQVNGKLAAAEIKKTLLGKPSSAPSVSAHTTSVTEAPKSQSTRTT